MEHIGSALKIGDHASADLASIQGILPIGSASRHGGYFIVGTVCQRDVNCERWSEAPLTVWITMLPLEEWDCFSTVDLY